MKRVILNLLFAALLLIGATAAADTFMKPVFVGEVVGQKQIAGQAFVTELIDGSVNIEAFVVVENTSGSDKKFHDDILAYGTGAEPSGLITLYARDPVNVHNREIVLYTTTSPAELNGEDASRLAFGAGCGMTESENGASYAWEIAARISDAISPGAKKLSIVTSMIREGEYIAIFLVYDQNGKIVFAESERFDSRQTDSVNTYIEDREVAAIEKSGSRIEKAIAYLYEKTN